MFQIFLTDLTKYVLAMLLYTNC